MFPFKKADKTRLRARQSCPECGNQLPLNAAGLEVSCPCLGIAAFLGEESDEVESDSLSPSMLEAARGEAVVQVVPDQEFPNPAEIEQSGTTPGSAKPPRVTLDRPGALESSAPKKPPVDARILGTRSLKLLGTYGAIVMITTGVVGATAYLFIAWMLHECFGKSFDPSQVRWYLAGVPLLVCFAACFLGYDIPPHGSTPQFLIRHWIVGLPRSFKQGIIKAVKIAAVEVVAVVILAALFLFVYGRDIALTRFAVRATIGASPTRSDTTVDSLMKIVADEESHSTAQELPIIKVVAGACYGRWNDLEKKQQCFRGAIAAYGKNIGQHPGVEALSYMEIGDALMQQGRFRQAEEAILQAIDIFDSNKTDELAVPEVMVFHPFAHSLLRSDLQDGITRRVALANLADCCWQQGKRERAQQIYDKLSLENPSGFFFVDRSGNPIAKAHFDATQRFSDGLAAVRLGKKWGYINTEGKFVVYPSYDKVGPFHEGKAVVSGWMFGPGGRRVWGTHVIDGNGNLIGSEATRYSVDRPGNLMGVPDSADFGAFNEGLAAVRTNGKWGYINQSGKFVIRPQFDSAADFSDGLAVVSEGKQFRYIDRAGKYAFDGTFEVAGIFKEGSAIVKRDGLYEIVDRSGKSRVLVATITGRGECLIEEARDFKEGLAAVRIQGLWGYIDKSGFCVIKPSFSKAYAFSDGMAVVEIPWLGFWLEKHIDKSGQQVADEESLAYANAFNNGLARAPDANRNKVGYISRDGKFKIKPRFVWAEDFSEGFASVRDQR